MNTEHNTDKIDLLIVGGKLSTRQCEIAISIWRKIGCFDTLSDDAHTLKRFREEKVVERTFYNYNVNDASHHDKLVRLVGQVIDYYRTEFTNGKGVNGIARITYTRGKNGKDSYTLICKPNKAERLKGWYWRVNTAATNIDRADRIQKDDMIAIPDNTFALMINKVCGKRPLEERPELLKQFITAAQDKLVEVSTTLALIESTKQMEASVKEEKDDKEKV